MNKWLFLLLCLNATASDQFLPLVSLNNTLPILACGTSSRSSHGASRILFTRNKNFGFNQRPYLKSDTVVGFNGKKISFSTEVTFTPLLTELAGDTPEHANGIWNANLPKGAIFTIEGTQDAFALYEDLLKTNITSYASMYDGFQNQFTELECTQDPAVLTKWLVKADSYISN